MDKNEEKKEVNNNMNNMKLDGPSQQFYNFLSDNNLDQYFENFKKNDCCNIQDVEYIIYDEDFLKNDIGIKNPIHRKKIIGEGKKLNDKMKVFKDSTMIPSILLHKLSKQGIVTMDILCNEVKNKHDLKNKLKIENENQRNLLWNIINSQINPQEMEREETPEGQYKTEGVQENVAQNDTAYMM